MLLLSRGSAEDDDVRGARVGASGTEAGGGSGGIGADIAQSAWLRKLLRDEEAGEALGEAREGVVRREHEEALRKASRTGANDVYVVPPAANVAPGTQKMMCST